MTKSQYVAWVAFRGRKPGVYYSWEECDEQIKEFPKSKHHAFETVRGANLAWEEWQRKIATKFTASTRPAPQNLARRGQESLDPVPPCVQPSVAQRTLVSSRPANVSQVHPSSEPWQPSTSQPAPYYYDPPPAGPLMPGHSNFQRAADNHIYYPQLHIQKSSDYQVSYPQLQSPPQTSQEQSSPLLPSRHFANLPKPAGYVDLTSPSPPPDFPRTFKRTASYMDLTEELENEGPDLKRARPQELQPPAERFLTAEERYELDQLERLPKLKPVHEETKIELSPEQQKVVNMAMRKNNIFLTGAAGCGKTVTLKEILDRFKKKKTGGNVQVVAPTGIAALPLEGKTTYSFAGWNPDSLRKSIDELLKNPKKSVVKSINDLDVLIVEEISMVENQFLERLNLLFQNACNNKLPFGGKQVIFLGDFHQLPPVKPFEFCLRCGESLPDRPEVVCISKSCKGSEDRMTFVKESDKWAFRAPVWRELKLRHVKLDQIHRQKDTRFQDILNKIRNSKDLTDAEWNDLERPKELPKHAFAVRLMSRLYRVKQFNEQQLGALKSQPKCWRALDLCHKLVKAKEGEWQDPNIPHKCREHRDTLKDHRFNQDLALKVGARVVLLQNLNPKLVNGSQGVIIGFQHATTELEKVKEARGEHQSIREESIRAYQESNSIWRPLVRFANGHVELIPAFPSASIRGGSNLQEQYVVCRTQIPLTLAWALSIHKSQGMTLDYVEVSSQDIFESGQLYVALSRATHLGGLRLTGFQRKQLPMDNAVLEFYTKTRWEKLQPRAAKKKA